MFVRKSELVRAEQEKVWGGPGSVTRLKWPHGLPEHLSVFTQVELKPGDGIGYHTHSEETEIFLVISGEVVFVDNDKRYVAFQGDAILTGNGDGHLVMNESNEMTTLLAVKID